MLKGAAPIYVCEVNCACKTLHTYVQETIAHNVPNSYSGRLLLLVWTGCMGVLPIIEFPAKFINNLFWCAIF